MTRPLLLIVVLAIGGCSSGRSEPSPVARDAESRSVGTWVAVTKPAGEEQHQIALELRPDGTYRTSNHGTGGAPPSVTEGTWTRSPDGDLALTPADGYAGSAKAAGDRLVVTFGPDVVEFKRPS